MTMKWAKPFFLHPSWWNEPSGPPAPLYTHIEWAKQLKPISAAIGAVALVACNPIVHHCRIGKITLK